MVKEIKVAGKVTWRSLVMLRGKENKNPRVDVSNSNTQ